jgi:DNA-binding SARP family transcriptional activator/DNA-binding beta-propeller fold protein YncE
VAVEISILGPVAAVRDGDPVDLGPPQQRALLALLSARAGSVVSVETIIDALWPEQPPATATKVVQTYVSRLRKTLGEETIARRGRGYVVDGADTNVDAARFERLVRDGHVADALALWRGPALADVVEQPTLRQEADRLEELRLRALEERFDAEIAAGNQAAVVADLNTLVGEHPLRERLVGQLMLALYGAGRQAEALAVYRTARQRLVDDLGIEPSPALRELERRILEQDPALAPPPDLRPADDDRPEPAGRARPRRKLVALAALIVVAAVAALAAALSRGGPEPVVIEPNSIVRIDSETNEVVESIPVGRHPSALVATEDAVWVANDRDRTLSRVDVRTGEVETIGGLAGVGFLTRDERGNVYASGWDYPLVWRIDPRKLEVVQRYRVRSRAVGLAVGGGSLWVVDRLVNAVTRIDLARGSVEDSVPVGADPLVAAFGFGALWVANSDDATVSVIRPGVDETETVRVRARPFGIAAGEGGVWVGSNTAATITRIDPDTRRVVRHIDIGALPRGLYSVAVGAGAVWAADWYQQSVTRVDPRTNTVEATILLPASPRDIAVAGGDVWVSVVEPGAD